jgi:hypothetical protein
MKNVLLTAIIILYAAGVYAQIEMPKELTCTERAFNFSFSLGTKWKIGTPKMGPAEVKSEELDYFPVWSLKPHGVKPETHLLSLFEMPVNAESRGYPIHQPNYTTFFKAADKPRVLLPGINFDSPTLYKIFNTDFPVKSISYNQ